MEEFLMSDVQIEPQDVEYERVVDSIPAGTIVEDGVVIEERKVIDPKLLNPLTARARLPKGHVSVDEQGQKTLDPIEEAQTTSAINNELINIFGKEGASVFMSKPKERIRSNTEVTITNVTHGQPVPDDIKAKLGIQS